MQSHKQVIVLPLLPIHIHFLSLTGVQLVCFESFFKGGATYQINIF